MMVAKIAILPLLAVSLGFAANDARSREDGVSLHERAHQLLDIPPAASAQDLEAAYRALFRYDKSGAQVPPDARTIEHFAEVVSRGVPPGALQHLILDRVSIGSSIPKHPQYGYPLQRTVVIDAMKAEAAAQSKGDPGSGARIARAVVFMAAEDNFSLGRVTSRSTLGSPEFLRLCQLADESIRGLVQLDADLSSEFKTCAQENTLAASALDAAIQDASDRVPPDILEECIMRLEKAWQATKLDARSQWQCCRILWKLKCLSKARGDAEASRRVRETVERWERSGNARIAASKGWVREVITLDGPVPRNSGIKVIRNPNDMKPGRP